MQMKRKIILSSGNKHKIKEITDILKDMPFEVVTKNDLELENFEVEESGSTLEENAYIKAYELGKLVKGIIIADDTGLFVDALNGEPGVHSARYSGEPVSYQNNNNLLLKKLENIPSERRTAYFRTVIIIILENGRKITAEGICNGRIAFESRGNNGFGYDPLFIVEGSDKTFAEMSDEEKNIISHRAKAVLNLRDILEEISGENHSNQ